MIFLLGPATVDVLRSGGQHRGKIPKYSRSSAVLGF